jgi:hypothetical protein
MDKKLSGLIVLFFLSFFVFLSVVVFRKPITRFTRASSVVASADKSIIIAWPLTVIANRQEPVTVTVFVRSDSNTPVANKTVLLQSTLGAVAPISTVSDAGGKATFTLTNSQVGEAQLSATIDNTVTTTQKVTVRFE